MTPEDRRAALFADDDAKWMYEQGRVDARLEAEIEIAELREALRLCEEGPYS